ncbi:MAG TPA: ZIP family metal transporter [Candidatus Pacearchaeota archaeon]|nr:ZIP family metal transporter [Candidatus Pacearchaeota archaeon]
MITQVLIFAFLTFLSTFLGGVLALRLKNKLPLIMGFAAGVILGVVCFDIFPEIINQVNQYNFDPLPAMVALAIGFLVFHILEKTILIHHTHEEEYAQHTHPQVGILSAIALAGHSFMDGLGIGLGFQVSQSMGMLVALAVISHDFTDGMNTVTLMLTHKNTEKKTLAFLFLDAIAPFLGALSTLFFTFSPWALTIYLGAFAGFLLYIGASDILPEAHSQNSSLKLVGLTVLGVVLVFLISSLY